MTRGLIGHTGFVGSTLRRARPFEICFNSRNIEEIQGRSFQTLICAGASAAKWLANQEPERDLAAINRLVTSLHTVRADHFVLVSTIDVYRQPFAVDEDDEPTTAELHPYGLHRLELERFVRKHFPRHTIMRLPGLFGEGLRKNLIFDLMHGNQTDRISPTGILQWYPMRRFANDLDVIMEADISSLNVAVEPIRTELIGARFFPNVAMGGKDLPSPYYDMWTKYPALLGGAGNYHLSAATVLDELERFVRGDR